MCQCMLAKFPRITFNKNVFGIAQLVTCRQTDTHNGEANKHTFTTTLGEQTTTWCNFPQKVDNYAQRQEKPCF